MKTVLMTAFEPFGGETINPSWEAVRALEGKQISGATIVIRQLPVVFSDVLRVLNQALEEVKPDAILSVGQAGGRSDITVERIGINVDDARIPDNAGHQPVDQPVVAGGPAADLSRLPIKAIVAAVREAGIPASVSQTAGTFTCNRVMYGLLHWLEQHDSPVREALSIFLICLTGGAASGRTEHGAGVHYSGAGNCGKGYAGDRRGYQTGWRRHPLRG